MALKPCHECGKDVSIEAKTCPNCGAPVKQKWEEWLEKKAVEGRAGWKRKAGKKEWGVFIIVLIGFIAYVVYTTNHPSKSSTSTSPSSSTREVSDLKAEVQSNTSWSGSFGDRTVEGSGNQIVDLPDSSAGGVVCCVVQKKTERGFLRARIISGERALSVFVETTAAYGVMTACSK